jgi:hypothetical protein
MNVQMWSGRTERQSMASETHVESDREGDTGTSQRSKGRCSMVGLVTVKK